jgi:uncharacterized protein (TIGR02452 family)
MTNTMRRKQIARETLQILEQESYQAPGGRLVSLARELRECLENTRCYTPEQIDAVRKQVRGQPAAFPQTRLEVSGESTLEAAARLCGSGELARVAALNFASAKYPGGGFLGGAQAQEESLARSSGLYKSLLACRAHYEFHRSHSSCLYSDHMIFSPRCPVFRTDDGTLLERPYPVDFITSPAPNAGAIRRNEPENVGKIGPVLRERSGKALALAAFHGCDALVLGAWGCGVFRNDAALVADAFFEHLGPGAAFAGRFRLALFAVLDRSAGQATLAAFRGRFGGVGSEI